jgi:hypothetical protein
MINKKRNIIIFIFDEEKQKKNCYFILKIVKLNDFFIITRNKKIKYS